MIQNDVVPNGPQTREITPGPAGYPVLGVLPKMWGGPLQFFVEAARQHGDVVRLELGPRRFYLLNHPDFIQHVLQDNYRNYRKGYEQIEPLIGKGLVSSDGNLWRRQRRLMQPAFHRQRLASFATTITSTTNEMLKRWQPMARRGEPIDVAAEMMRLTMDVILKTMFSTHIADRADVAGRAFETTLEHVNMRLMAPFDWLESLPTPGNRRFQRALRTLDDIVYGIIDERRRHPTGTNDLLSMLLEARDEETGESMSDQQLRDEVMTIFLAGHETTANALAWTWYLLSKYPEAERRLEAELATVLGGRPPTFEDLPRLTYTRMVIDEALRLYPPAWMFAREAVQADEIGGYRIPAGARIMLSPYVAHRHPGFWDNPEGFDPERFTPERSEGRPRYAYFPFGGGPRRCIGEGFALMEAQLVLATVVQRHRLDLVPGHPVEPQPMATLRPRQGILVTLHAKPA